MPLEFKTPGFSRKPEKKSFNPLLSEVKRKNEAQAIAEQERKAQAMAEQERKAQAMAEQESKEPPRKRLKLDIENSSRPGKGKEKALSAGGASSREIHQISRKVQHLNELRGRVDNAHDYKNPYLYEKEVHKYMDALNREMRDTAHNSKEDIKAYTQMWNDLKSSPGYKEWKRDNAAYIQNPNPKQRWD